MLTICVLSLLGHILNVQSLRVPYDKDQGVADPEQTYHHFGDLEMQVVRIYYNHDKHQKLREQIGENAKISDTQTCSLITLRN